MADWSHVPAAWRFVGGRRHYNTVRSFAAAQRQMLLARLFLDGLPFTQREIAKRWHVHESTISRDLRRLNAAGLPKIARQMRALGGTVEVKITGRCVTVKGELSWP